MTATQDTLTFTRLAAGPLVAGIDLSITSAGVALSNACDPGPGTLHRVRSKTHSSSCRTCKKDNLAQRAHRLTTLAGTVVELTQHADLVVIEQPAYSTGGLVGSHDVSGAWWLIVQALTASGIPVAEVPPSTRARYAVGYAEKKRVKGVPAPDASKDAVLAAVINRFPGWNVTGNDVADALLLCAMGCEHLGYPIVAMPVLHRKALAAVVWPTDQQVTQ